MQTLELSEKLAFKLHQAASDKGVTVNKLLMGLVKEEEVYNRRGDVAIVAPTFGIEQEEYEERDR